MKDTRVLPYIHLMTVFQNSGWRQGQHFQRHGCDTGFTLPKLIAVEDGKSFSCHPQRFFLNNQLASGAPKVKCRSSNFLFVDKNAIATQTRTNFEHFQMNYDFGSDVAKKTSSVIAWMS